jgi:hypothetical protein
MFTWTDNPYKEMWNQLKVLAIETNVRHLLTGHLPSERPSIYPQGQNVNRKARQIAMTVAQAADYFDAAEQVSIATSPLLLFYGMLSLAKALIVANQVDTFLEDISYHGLHTRTTASVLHGSSVATYAENPAGWNLPDEYAITAGGVFREFSQVVQGFSLPDVTVFRLRDLFSVCAEMSKMFERHFRSPSRCVYFYTCQEDSQEQYRLRLEFQRETQHVVERIPQLANDFTVRQGSHGSVVFESNPNISEWPEYLGRYNPPVGGKYIIGGTPYETHTTEQGRPAPIRGERYLDPAVVDYAAVFILGNCVRYKQDLWRRAMLGEESGILSLMEIYLGVVRRRFPNFILNLFFNEKIAYGMPGHIM